MTYMVNTPAHTSLTYHRAETISCDTHWETSRGRHAKVEDFRVHVERRQCSRGDDNGAIAVDKRFHGDRRVQTAYQQ